MFSAITTGPDTPKTWPKRDSRSSSLILTRFFFAFGSAPAIVEDEGEGKGRGGRGQKSAMHERRQGRLTTMLPMRHPGAACGKLAQSLFRPVLEAPCRRLLERLRVD